MTTPRNLLTILSLAAALVAAGISTTSAATYTWDGLGANTNWTTSENWNPDGSPANNGTSITTFNTNATPPTGYYAPVVDTPYNINSLQIQSNISNGTAWNFTGSALTFTGPSASIQSGTNLASGSNVANVIANDIVMNSALTVTVGTGSAASELRLNGNISGNFALTMGFTLGTLRLNGNNSYTGGFNMTRGSLIFGSDTAFGTGGNITMTGTGSYAMTATGTRTVANNFVLGNVSSGTASTRFTNTVTFDGDITLGNAINQTTNIRGLRSSLASAGATSIVTFNGDLTMAAGASGNATNFQLGGGQSGSQEFGTVANAANNRLTFNGTSNHTGTTIIGASATPMFGTAFMNGDWGTSSSTQVYNGMVLRGTGTLGATTINAGAILAPGGTSANASTLGVLNIKNSVSMAGTGTTADTIATLRFNLAAGGLSDKLNITGGSSVVGNDFTLGSNVTLTLNGTLEWGSPYVLVSWQEAMTPASYGTFASITLNGSTANWDTAVSNGWSLQYGANSVSLVPEPSTYALIAAAGVVFMIFRRRKMA